MTKRAFTWCTLHTQSAKVNDAVTVSLPGARSVVCAASLRPKLSHSSTTKLASPEGAPSMDTVTAAVSVRSYRSLSVETPAMRTGEVTSNAVEAQLMTLPSSRSHTSTKCLPAGSATSDAVTAL